jgi:UDP-N-acetylmuramate--L-alanine ligase
MKIHILGIAGHAMAGVALAAKQLGHEVTGTDESAYEPMSSWLTEQGIVWFRDADPAHLKGVDLLVLGGGIANDHPELVAAQGQDIDIQSYPELVSSLIKTNNRIVVTGTHGKTTTTSLIAWLLESAGKNPDYLIGIRPKNFKSSVRLSTSQVAVLEGDEYRSSRLDTSSKFRHYQPKSVIITSIEMDHPDLFKDVEDVKQRFVELMQQLPQDGYVVYCNDSDIVRDVATQAQVPVESYGEGGDWQALNTKYNESGISYDIQHDGIVLGSISFPLYGAHNVANSLAALAICLKQGISLNDLQAGALKFLGASRRFERISADGTPVTVIDDYAHHPTEVAATLAAARQHFTGKIHAIFQPHTYSRTQSLLNEYQTCFVDADQAYVVDIEGAREAGLEKVVSAADIATADNVIYMANRDELLTQLKSEVSPGDVVLCMSVNGYQQFAQEVSQLLSSD